jgi:esterase/lipase superfamily enzyme
MFARFADESTQQSDVLVYIHGYNTSWEEAVADAMALQLLLNNDVKKKVVVVLFTWPSDGIILPWISYFSDRSDASHCRFALLRSLLLIRDRMARLRQCEEGRKQNVAETPASGDTPSDLLRRSLLCSRKIHLLCHSMGNHVLEQALAESIANPAFAVSDRLFDHVFMFAPDVDTDATEHGKPLSQLSNLCQNATVYYNKQDVALGVSAFTKHARERLGRTGPARPALTDRTFMYVDCSWAVTKGLIEHGYHLGGMALRDMSDSIQGVRQSKRAYREGDPVFPNLWLLKRIPWYKKWM